MKKLSDLVKEYPNDQDLGAAIRSLLTTKDLEDIDIANEEKGLK